MAPEVTLVMARTLNDNREAIAALCERFRVARLEVFGSVLGDDFKPGESDVDLLVKFMPMAPRELADAYFGLLDALRELLAQEVDLVMFDAVTNPYIAREIARTKRLLYAA